MDKEHALNIAKKYAELIKKKYDVKRVFLFGSTTRGMNTENSDIDIAVIMNKFTDFFEIQFEMMKLRRQVDLRIEPHPFLESDFNIKNPFTNEIIKYGIEI
jgi:uncharacterized protein